MSRDRPLGFDLSTDAATSARMQRQRRRDTSIEVALRSRLHAAGLRYRLHERPLPGLRREADIVFRRAKVAVFVDGCFWHGCPTHSSKPKRNNDFWRTKIQRNSERDHATDQALRDAGWLPVRVWEHESVEEAAASVQKVIEKRLARG
ncbi:very short patch repair endonuclease [Mycobacterium sp. C31M]